jgi:hypothetical protein
MSKIDLLRIAEASGHSTGTHITGSVRAHCTSRRCIVSEIAVGFRSLLGDPVAINCPICGQEATVTAIETRHDEIQNTAKYERKN